MAPVLTLFLSHKGSLRKWEKQGILSREILLYLYYIEQGVFRKVQIFSYDINDRILVNDQQKQDPRYRNIIILSPPRQRYSSILWSILGPWRHRQTIRQSHVLKTNQISGSWSALIARITSRVPLALRMGYILSRRLRKNGHSFRSAVAMGLEKISIALASIVIVPSRAVANSISGNIASSKINVIPTYVDTQDFAAKQIYDFSQPLVTVARLTEQKNLANLIRACAATQIPLTIYGSGPLEHELKALALKQGAQIQFKGRVSNSKLNERLQQHSIFIIPSLHEGLPKVLIEAMTSALVCIGSDIPGIRDCIDDGKTGYLINGFNAQDIAKALQRVLACPDEQIGRNARLYSESHHSLPNYVAREAALLKALI